MLVPVKAFPRPRAGSRALDDAQRARLARGMATGVLDAARDLPTFVVCDDDEVAAWADRAARTCIWGPGLGLNGAVDDGVAARRRATASTTSSWPTPTCPSPDSPALGRPGRRHPRARPPRRRHQRDRRSRPPRRVPRSPTAPARSPATSPRPLASRRVAWASRCARRRLGLERRLPADLCPSD